MNPERARELLGGLVAGILTPAERQSLFEAALHDQVLFNEVADELEFAAFLESPEARAQLANRIEVAPARRPWWALRPRWLALSGALAASVIVFIAVWPRPAEVPAQSLVPPAPPAAVFAPPAPKSVVRSQPEAIARAAPPERRAAPMARAVPPPQAPAPVDLPRQPADTAETQTATAAAPPPPSKKEPVQNLTQVAVLDFANSSQQNQSGAQAADLLSSQLGNSGQVRVIDRDKVQQAAQSQSASGRPPSAEEAAALGRTVGADAVITGSVRGIPGSFGALISPSAAAKAKRTAEPNVSVTAEIIDTKKATPLGTVSAGGASLQRATASVGSQIQSRLAKPAEGRVTHLDGELLTVKFDESPVPPVGAHCDVMRETTKIGEIVITSISGPSAVGKFSGTGQPNEGDRVTASR